MLLPIVRRKTMNAAVEEVICRLNDAHSTHRREIERLREQHRYEVEQIFKPAVGKICSVGIRTYAEPMERWALEVHMETAWIRAVLSHGNSDREIEALADTLAHQVKREVANAIKGRNISRF